MHSSLPLFLYSTTWEALIFNIFAYFKTVRSASRLIICNSKFLYRKVSSTVFKIASRIIYLSESFYNLAILTSLSLVTEIEMRFKFSIFTVFSGMHIWIPIKQFIANFLSLKIKSIVEPFFSTNEIYCQTSGFYLWSFVLSKNRLNV